MTWTTAWTKAKLPTIRARWSARRMIGVEASFKTGGEIGPKKLIGRFRATRDRPRSRSANRNAR